MCADVDWTVDKGSVQNSNGALALILTETNGGTRISSTRFVHYGTITTTREYCWVGVPLPRAVLTCICLVQ